MPQPRRSTTKDAPPTVEGTAHDIGTRENPATGKELVVAPDNPSSVFVALDKADEELVAAEIAGDLIETWAYDFQVGGKDVRGLSFEGVNQAVRVMNARGIGRIESPPEIPPQFSDTFDAEGNPIWECLAFARDTLTGGSSWGLAHAEKFPTKNRGTETYHDPMAKRKALSKAQRNAKAALIPGPLKVEILTGVTGAQIRRIQTPRQAAELAAGEQQQQRAQRTTAAKPKQEKTATAPQQRMLMAKFKEAGIGGSGDKEKRRRDAILAWVTGTTHLDRVPFAKVQELVDAIADQEGTLAVILDSAGGSGGPDQERAQWIATNILQIGQQSEAGAEQQQLTTEEG